MRPGPLKANNCRQRAKKFPHSNPFKIYLTHKVRGRPPVANICRRRANSFFSHFPSLPKYFKIVRGRTPAANIGRQRTTLKKGLTQCSHLKKAFTFTNSKNNTYKYAGILAKE